MTPANKVGTKEPEVDWRNFRKACQLAKDSGCVTAMITSKGEPTLFPDQITKFLREMKPYDFPIIEMQTNGLLIAEGKRVTKVHLADWYSLGLTTMCISVVHYDPEKNRQIYVPYRKQYIDLPALIKLLHDSGYTVRLTTIMAKGLIDSPQELRKMLEFACRNEVEQLTCTPVTKPDDSENQKIFNWTAEHSLTPEQFAAIKSYVEANGNLVLSLAHGSRVYNMRLSESGALPVAGQAPATRGQNLCLSNCITVDPDCREMRSIIFFPDGHVRYAWQYEGAILF